MLKNYFKIALRNLWKHRTFSIIIVVGMAAAFAAAILLSVTAQQELTYDQFHQNKDHVYQLYFEESGPNGLDYGQSMPSPLTPALKGEYSDIVRASRYLSRSGELVRYQQKELDLMIRGADPEFLSMFSFPILSGNKTAPMKELTDAVITENCAEKIFGAEEPVGKTIEVKSDGQWQSYQVSAVIKNIPDNSSFKFDILTRFENYTGYQRSKERWDNMFHLVYVQLNASTTQASLEKRLPSFSQKYQAEKIRDMKRDGAKPDKDGQYVRLRMTPLNDLHFTKVSKSGAVVNRFYPYLLLIISAFILFIACVNFVNLSLARSFTRAKEIGLRKVMGAHRWQLIAQFWGEAVIISLASLLVGIALAYWLLPYYKATFYSGISMQVLMSPMFLLYMLAGFLLITLLAGGYPAWVVSAFNTVLTVKGKLKKGKSQYLRNSLMVVQFGLSSLLIICTFIAWQQLQYMRNKSLGYDKEEIISIPIGGAVEGEKAANLLRNKLAGERNVISVSGSDMNLGMGLDRSSSTSIVGFDYKNRGVQSHFQTIDYDYLKTFGIRLLEGRDFSREYGADSMAVLINEQMAQQIGEKNIVGTVLPVGDNENYTVIGVVKDYNFKSLHQQIEPLTMTLRRNWNYLFVRVQPGSLKTSLEVVQKAWKEIDPSAITEASFLDENTDRQYQKETKLSQIFISGAVLTILISCMGLFAIVLLVIVQRTREIGIRKVLGAGVPHIVALVSKDFIKLVVVAILIASPLAWYAMSQWLQDFHYRIQIQWWVFALAGIVAVLIAFITLSFQSIRAALRNPVKSLRSD